MSNKIVKDALALTAITLVAGFLLGAVHEVTLEPIAKAEADKKEKAYQEVFEDAAGFEEVALTEELSAQLRSALDAENYTAQTIDEVMEATDGGGAAAGYVITVTSGEGYGGDIQFSIGIQNDGTVNGISILSIGETAGLGMNANTDAFRGQFAGKQVDKFVYTKNGASSDGEIDALSGDRKSVV